MRECCEGETVSGRRTQSCTNDGQQRLLHHLRNNLAIDRICIWRFHPSFFVLSYDSVDKAFSTRLCWFAFTIFWYDNLYKIVGRVVRRAETAYGERLRLWRQQPHSYNNNNRRRRIHRAEFSESIWSGLCCCCDSTQYSTHCRTQIYNRTLINVIKIVSMNEWMDESKNRQCEERYIVDICIEMRQWMTDEPLELERFWLLTIVRRRRRCRRCWNKK